MYVAGLYPPSPDTPIWHWNRFMGSWEAFYQGQILAPRAIWHPFQSNAPSCKPSRDLNEAAGAVEEGKIGPALPPYEFPHFKPTEMAKTLNGYVWYWRPKMADWAVCPAGELQTGQFWWPKSAWGLELYGKPEGCP